MSWILACPLKHLGQSAPQRLPVPIRGATNTQMSQDCRPVPARGHMTVLEIPFVWGCDSQLFAKVLHNIGQDIARPARKARPLPEKAQLKRKPYTARTIDTLDQSHVIEGQAPNLDK